MAVVEIISRSNFMKDKNKQCFEYARNGTFRHRTMQRKGKTGGAERKKTVGSADLFHTQPVEDQVESVKARTKPLFCRKKERENKFAWPFLWTCLSW